jgi:hypothetical protein
MATPTDANFGAGFDAAAFRSAIRSTMEMGLPNTAAERATFRWNVERTYEREDPSHNPYEWDEVPSTELTHADVQIPVAVEFSARPAASLDTAIGQFDVGRAIITILDVDYELVRGADLVLLGENTYVIDFVGPPIGLFEVTVYQAYASALDET